MSSSSVAVELASRYGLAVFPLPLGARRPRERVRPTSDPAEAGRVWQDQPPGANIGVGVACRPSGVVVIDIDGAQGHRSWVAACAAHGQDPEPATLTVATPHGRHIYYRAPRGCTLPSTSGGRTALGPGIDTRTPGRSTGGYVVGPGSVVVAGAYTVLDSSPPVPLPAWVAAALHPSASRAAHGRDTFR